ncbi:MAG: phosphoribosylformylglycinamidine synthase I [Planctomycetota bacterium]|nr:phosphoribosylformylglycinamidine synthase I [Planctomycetota bacterium]
MVGVLVLRAAGTNCDKETVFAFECAGAKPETVHINQLLSEPNSLSFKRYQVVVIPGGFTYGDDISAGKVLSLQLRTSLMDALNRFIEDGGVVFGICNGFQVLVKTGLLPRLNGTPVQSVTLMWNDSGRYEDRWVHLRCETDRCVAAEKGDTFFLPVAHAEGKFVAKDATVLSRLEKENYVFLRYIRPDGSHAQNFPDNPNGSQNAIAGICDRTGRVFGLMPHAERHIFAYQNPLYHRQRSRSPVVEPSGDGMKIFRRIVNYFK